MLSSVCEHLGQVHMCLRLIVGVSVHPKHPTAVCSGARGFSPPGAACAIYCLRLGTDPLGATAGQLVVSHVIEWAGICFSLDRHLLPRAFQKLSHGSSVSVQTPSHGLRAPSGL